MPLDIGKHPDPFIPLLARCHQLRTENGNGYDLHEVRNTDPAVLQVIKTAMKKFKVMERKKGEPKAFQVLDSEIWWEPLLPS